VAIFLPCPDPRFPWEAAYRAAILETDNSHLADRIREAEEIITRRLRNLPKLQENEEERELAVRVLRNLTVLRQERLMPPGRIA